MEFVQMKCPNCHADLDVDKGIDSFYCKYCGTKIMVTGQSKTAIRANTVLKIVDKVKDSISEERRYNEEHREEIEARERAAREEARKHERRGLLIMVLLLAALFLAMVLQVYIPEKRETDRLNALYAEATIAMNYGNYDEAMAKANLIHWTADNKSKKASWDLVREGLVKMIEEKQNS